MTPESTRSQKYYRPAEERSSLVKEALRLVGEIRDYLQLQAGQLSLLESRKSIEASNNQLQESTRGKQFASCNQRSF